MLVELKTLHDNPFRDFKVDPIDDANVEALKQSMKQDGFWGGVVCRRVNGHIEIGAGHHRVRAALKAGIRTADVFVGELDDGAMIRVYARENATQRGNSSTAVAGTVASAVRFLAKAIMSGTIVTEKFFSDFDIDTTRRHFEGDKGLGREIVVAFLDGVPGVNDGTVQQQLANLKSSGDYARIIQEVRDAIEREHREALKALERAEKERAKAEEAERKAEEERKATVARAKAAREEAEKRRADEAQKRAEIEAKLAAKRRTEADAEMKKFDALRTMRDTANKAASKAAEREVTFDFEGVAKYLHNDNQVRVFREAATGAGVKPGQPVKRQAALAAELVRLAKQRGAELSGAFIRENVMTLAIQAKSVGRELSKEEMRSAHERDIKLRMDHQQGEFARAVRSMIAAGAKIAELFDKNKGVTFAVSGEFRTAVRSAAQIIDKLNKRV